MANVRWIISLTVQYNFLFGGTQTLASQLDRSTALVSTPSLLTPCTRLSIFLSSLFFFLGPFLFWLKSHNGIMSLVRLHCTFTRHILGALICMIEHRGFVKPPCCKSTLYTYNYFEKGCRKNVHATIPKGNMGYDRTLFLTTLAVEPTFVAFL